MPFTTQLKVLVGNTVTPKGDRAYYTLLSDLNYKSERYCITVRAGFPTDFATVPRIPLVYAIFGGLPNTAASAVIHDAICRYELLPRPECDEIFRQALIESGVGAWKARLMYWAVRAFGGYSGNPPQDGLGELVECKELAANTPSNHRIGGG